jgi:hypothetical protein
LNIKRFTNRDITRARPPLQLFADKEQGLLMLGQTCGLLRQHLFEAPGFARGQRIRGKPAADASTPLTLYMGLALPAP